MAERVPHYISMERPAASGSWIYEAADEYPIMVQYARADGALTASLTISCTERWVKAAVIERLCGG